MHIRRIGVIGAGLMGAGIAEVCAAGAEVVLVDLDDAAVGRGTARIEKSLASRQKRGALSQDQVATVRSNLRTATDVSAVADCDLVIEAIVESVPAKHGLFAELGDVLDDSAVLASNTSSLPIATLAKGYARPDRLLGLHFFNPPPLLDLIEVVPSLATAAEVVDAIDSWFSDDLGRTVIRAQDHAGFVVNALLVPYLLSAVRMLESGRANREDIDTGMVRGCGHPMGPLRLLDLIGLDTIVHVAEGLWSEWRSDDVVPPALLRRMVDVGHLGRKTGQGFYTYDR